MEGAILEAYDDMIELVRMMWYGVSRRKVRKRYRHLTARALKL